MSKKLLGNRDSSRVMNFTYSGNSSTLTINFDFIDDPDLTHIVLLEYSKNNDSTIDVDLISIRDAFPTSVRIDGNVLVRDLANGQDFSSNNYITSVNYINTFKFNSFNSSFRGCKNIVNIPTIYWHFNKDIDLSFAFADSNIQRIDASNWDLDKITSVNNMFLNCNNLSYIRLVSDNTSKIRSIVNQLPTHTSGTYTIDLSGNSSSVLSSLSSLSRSGWTIKKS